MQTPQAWALLIVLVLEKGHVFFVLHMLDPSGLCPVSGEFCCFPPKTVGAYKLCEPEWTDVHSGLGVSILHVARAACSHARTSRHQPDRGWNLAPQLWFPFSESRPVLEIPSSVLSSHSCSRFHPFVP